MRMRRIPFILVLVAVFLASCSIGPPVQPKSPVKIPRSSPETTPRDLEKVLHVTGVGEAQVDLVTNQLIITTFRRGHGGMNVKLFGNYVRVPIVGVVHDVVRVTLQDITIYVLTIGADDQLGMVTFQLKKGRLYIR